MIGKILSIIGWSLGLLQHSFSTNITAISKKHLYISLVRSQLMFCSTLWKPDLLKDIRQLEQLQHRATKYILNDYTSNYKSRLLELKNLPLMYVGRSLLCFLIFQLFFLEILFKLTYYSQNYSWNCAKQAY